MRRMSWGCADPPVEIQHAGSRGSVYRAQQRSMIEQQQPYLMAGPETRRGVAHQRSILNPEPPAHAEMSVVHDRSETSWRGLCAKIKLRAVMGPGGLLDQAGSRGRLPPRQERSV